MHGVFNSLPIADLEGGSYPSLMDAEMPLPGNVATEIDVRDSPYFGRDGAAEAVADIINDNPIALYWHRVNGRAPGFSIPGLRGLGRGASMGEPNGASIIWREMPEAYWPWRYHTEHDRAHAAIAVRFASAYNIRIFWTREIEIRRDHPEACLAEFADMLRHHNWARE